MKWVACFGLYLPGFEVIRGCERRQDKLTIGRVVTRVLSLWVFENGSETFYYMYLIAC